MGPGLTNTTSDCRCGVVFAFWVLGWEVCVQSIISTCEGVGLSGNGLWNVWFEDFYFLMLFCILINFIYNRKNSGMAWHGMVLPGHSVESWWCSLIHCHLCPLEKKTKNTQHEETSNHDLECVRVCVSCKHTPARLVVLGLNSAVTQLQDRRKSPRALGGPVETATH